MTINCKGELIDLSSPKVMGIVNITPDSFYKNSRFNENSSILNNVEEMLKEGASFIDVGGYSSRPGGNEVSEQEELQRVVPAIEAILKEFPKTIISIDTFRSKVATESIKAGAAIINDISGGQIDEFMLKTVGSLKVPYVMMHMRGNPKTMQTLTDYDDIVKDIISYFSERIQLAKQHHILDIIIDPGFGFAKTTAQNYELLKKLNVLKIVDKPILAGISRKSMIYKVLGSDSSEALNGTTALHMLALNNGASLLRVHDVKEAMECVKLYNQMNI
ncbi:dihydropteroate synthase [Winogradskyella sp. A3E31]|uniref:dihydropteroate synthase n=1 Tax=Winogradskyella sp. A3E31 TaxID=3349637 RepID=UPI00398A653A